MLYRSLPQLRYRSAAPSSEGALSGYHLYTHVLVNDPATGYGIFIENMLETAQGIAENNNLKDAS